MNFEAAKKYLKKKNYSLENPEIKEIKNFLEKNNNLSLCKNFFYFYIEEKRNVDELKNIYLRINQNKNLLEKLPHKIHQIFNFNQLVYYLNYLDKYKNYKYILNKLPGKLRNLVKEDDNFFNLINSFDFQNSEHIKLLENEFINKCSKYKNYKELINNLSTLYKNILSKEDLKKQLKNDNIEIIYDQDNILMVIIDNFKESKKYGSRSWCIVTSYPSFIHYNQSNESTLLNSYFFSRTGSIPDISDVLKINETNIKKTLQIFIWDYNKEKSNEYHLIGLTTNKNKIRCIQDRENNPVSIDSFKENNPSLVSTINNYFKNYFKRNNQIKNYYSDINDTNNIKMILNDIINYYINNNIRNDKVKAIISNRIYKFCLYYNYNENLMSLFNNDKFFFNDFSVYYNVHINNMFAMAIKGNNYRIIHEFFTKNIDFFNENIKNTILICSAKNEVLKTYRIFLENLMFKERNNIKNYYNIILTYRTTISVFFNILKNNKNNNKIIKFKNKIFNYFLNFASDKITIDKKNHFFYRKICELNGGNDIFKRNKNHIFLNCLNNLNNLKEIFNFYKEEGVFKPGFYNVNKLIKYYDNYANYKIKLDIIKIDSLAYVFFNTDFLKYKNYEIAIIIFSIINNISSMKINELNLNLFFDFIKRKNYFFTEKLKNKTEKLGCDYNSLYLNAVINNKPKILNNMLNYGLPVKNIYKLLLDVYQPSKEVIKDIPKNKNKLIKHGKHIKFSKIIESYNEDFFLRDIIRKFIYYINYNLNKFDFLNTLLKNGFLNEENVENRYGLLILKQHIIIKSIKHTSSDSNLFLKKLDEYGFFDQFKNNALLKKLFLDDIIYSGIVNNKYTFIKNISKIIQLSKYDINYKHINILLSPNNINSTIQYYYFYHIINHLNKKIVVSNKYIERLKIKKNNKTTKKLINYLTSNYNVTIK